MLLHGDDLSVQLFIASIAIRALGVAMTQAGWTHRWFVRAMFVLAVLLAVMAGGWRYIEDRIPLIDIWLQAAASSRVAWFLAGIVPILKDVLRRRRESRIKRPPGWVSLYRAMHTFARKDLLDRYAYVMERTSASARESEALDEQIAVLNTAVIAVDESTRLELAEQPTELSGIRVQKSREERQSLIQTEIDCSEALRMNIYSQLQGGRLVAKGFLSPHTPGSSERIIPGEEWRFLILDDQDDKAIGRDFEYIALLIGELA